MVIATIILITNNAMHVYNTVKINVHVSSFGIIHIHTKNIPKQLPTTVRNICVQLKEGGADEIAHGLKGQQEHFNSTFLPTYRSTTNHGTAVAVQNVKGSCQRLAVHVKG